MKLTESPARIVGLQAGSIKIRMPEPDKFQMTANFYLVRDDGQPIGKLTKTNNWSEKTIKAVQELMQSLEEEMMPDVFNEAPGSEDGETPDEQAESIEPPQI